MSQLLNFSNPERLAIVDDNGQIVRLCDRNRTVLVFDASERLRARRRLNALNNYPLNLVSRKRFRLVAEAEGQPARPDDRKAGA